MHCWLIIEESGPNIHNIYGVDNIVADTLSIFPSKSVNKYEPRTSNSQCRTNELFTIIWEENNEDRFLLNILNVQREQQKEPRKVNLQTQHINFGSGIWLLQ